MHPDKNSAISTKETAKLMEIYSFLKKNKKETFEYDFKLREIKSCEAQKEIKVAKLIEEYAKMKFSTFRIKYLGKEGAFSEERCIQTAPFAFTSSFAAFSDENHIVCSKINNDCFCITDLKYERLKESYKFPEIKLKNPRF